jgi:hypothetical protein
MHTYRIHERNFCGAAPGLSARGARLEAAKARAPWQCHVTHVRRAKHTDTPKLHCKKRLRIFLSPAGMSPTKLSLAGNNLISPGQREFG